VDREQLVRDSMPLVERVAASLSGRLPSQVERCDLTQAGFLGLLDAAARFDWEKGVRFKTYAELRIRGAILDSLRELDWVPRSLRRKRRELASAWTSLEKRLGRAPDEAELALELKVSVGDLRAATENVRKAELASGAAESVDRVVPFLSDPNAVDPVRDLERRELVSLLARALRTLTERERLALKLYYHDELTMKEVGRVLGVNESRVSQIHSKAIARLRRRLQRDLGTGRRRGLALSA
jgi:RNA polymerase sigma factor for flagellar operon FliA